MFQKIRLGARLSGISAEFTAFGFTVNFTPKSVEPQEIIKNAAQYSIVYRMTPYLSAFGLGQKTSVFYNFCGKQRIFSRSGARIRAGI